MQDDWAAYCEEQSRIVTTIPSPPINGTHINGASSGIEVNAVTSSMARLRNAAVNDRIEEIEKRLAKRARCYTGDDHDRHSDAGIRAKWCRQDSVDTG